MIFSYGHLAETMSVYNAMSVVQHKLGWYFLFALFDFSKFIVIANQIWFINLQSSFWFLAFLSKWFSVMDIWQTLWVCIMQFLWYFKSFSHTFFAFSIFLCSPICANQMYFINLQSSYWFLAFWTKTFFSDEHLADTMSL